MNTIAEKHPNSFVLLLPKTRDEQNYVRDWLVLNTSRHYDEILKVAKYYRAETNKKIKRDKVNVLSTFLISLYDYDHDSLQLDITKLIVLSPSSEFPAKDKRKLLQILWSTIQMLYADDWSEVLNEVNRLGEWARANPEEFPVK